MTLHFNPFQNHPPRYPFHQQKNLTVGINLRNKKKPLIEVTLFCMHEVHDLYNYLSFVFNNLLHACIAAIYAFIDESGYAPTNSLFRLSHFLETSRKKCFDSLTSCSIHDFMQRHHFVTVGSRIFKARHEKSSARTGGWIVTPGSSSFALLGVDRNHWIFWLWRSRRLWWWISHVDQWRWVLDVKSIWNKRSFVYVR